MKKNFLNGSIHKDPTIIRTMTGHYELNEFVKVAPNSLFTQEQIFYIRDFSSNYNILLGRKLLEANHAKIDYLNNRTTISGLIFYTQKH